jgi:fucose 4-O-acetylase-like acetyltransferase
MDHPQLSTTGYKPDCQPPQNHDWPTGTPVVNVLFVARQHGIASLVEQTNLMKANTTKNLASVAMLVALSPFLALAMLVSIKTAGIKDNTVLLLLLTLLSAVLSGINGFGRRTATAVQLSPAKTRGANPSRASVTFAGSPSNNA